MQARCFAEGGIESLSLLAISSRRIDASGNMFRRRFATPGAEEPRLPKKTLESPF